MIMKKFSDCSVKPQEKQYESDSFLDKEESSCSPYKITNSAEPPTWKEGNDLQKPKDPALEPPHLRETKGREGAYFNVQQTSYICLCLPVIFVILLLQMPESPYFYMIKNNENKAIQALKWLRRREDVQEELNKIKEDTEKQKNKSAKWKDLISVPNNKNALITGVFLRMSQQLCGITIFSTSSQYIFQKAGGNLEATMASIIFSGLCWGFNFTLFASVEKFGRKKSYMYSLLGAGITLLAVASFLFIEQHSLYDISSFKWMPLAGMIIYLFMYSFGLGVVPTIMLGEIFPCSIKAKALCIMNVVFGLGIFISTYLFYTLKSIVGLYCPFLIFSVCCFINVILTSFILPETKGQTLEQIQEHLKTRVWQKNDKRFITH